MNVLEITPTIHGEMPYSGYPCTLVRFKECNLNCPYCDACLNATPVDMSVEDIVQAVEEINYYDVLITGGEPLLYGVELQLLIDHLSPTYRITIETNGTLNPRICGSATVAMDVKLFDPKLIRQAAKWLPFLKPKDLIKFVYWDEASFSKGWDFIHAHHRKIKSPIVFSPVHKDKVYLQSFLTRCHKWPYLSITMQTQIHKVLGAV
jgi:7-carboxy-7-deazaguanine synthase